MRHLHKIWVCQKGPFSGILQQVLPTHFFPFAPLLQEVYVQLGHTHMHWHFSPRCFQSYLSELPKSPSWTLFPFFLKQIKPEQRVLCAQQLWCVSLSSNLASLRVLIS